MVAKDFFEVLISYEFFSIMVLKVARKSIGERVNIDLLIQAFLNLYQTSPDKDSFKYLFINT